MTRSTRCSALAQSVILGSRPFTPAEILLEAERDFRELAAWVREMVAKRRVEPEEDMVTDIVREHADNALGEDDIVGLLAALIGAGSEATSMVTTTIARMLLEGGANRDPAAYENPDVLDLDRDLRELTIFGSGPHYCLGANLARAEIAAMIDALLDVVPPGSSVFSDALEYRDMGLSRRAINLPVQLGPGSRG